MLKMILALLMLLVAQVAKAGEDGSHCKDECYNALQSCRDMGRSTYAACTRECLKAPGFAVCQRSCDSSKDSEMDRCDADHKKCRSGCKKTN